MPFCFIRYTDVNRFINRPIYQERTAMCFFTSAVLLTFHKYAVKQKPLTTIALLL